MSVPPGSAETISGARLSDLTRHFGIAPLLMPLPSGVETLTVPAATALSMRVAGKPYWHFADGNVSIITDTRADVVAKALREFTPSGSDQ